MHTTGRNTYLWHLEQAAIQERIAERCDRRQLWWDAQQAREKAQSHRERALILDLEERAA